MKNVSRIIKFTNETGCKYFKFENLEFFANGNNKEGYNLEVCEFYHVPHEYILNKYCSRPYKTNFSYQAVNIDIIRKQILSVIENYYKNI
jgi:hypothetical protein